MPFQSASHSVRNAHDVLWVGLAAEAAAKHMAEEEGLYAALSQLSSDMAVVRQVLEAAPGKVRSALLGQGGATAAFAFGSCRLVGCCAQARGVCIYVAPGGPSVEG